MRLSEYFAQEGLTSISLTFQVIMYHQSWLKRSQSNSKSGTADLGASLQRWGVSLAAAALFASSAAFASPARLATPVEVSQPSNVLYGSVTDRFANLPAGTRLRKRPSDVKIYEYDQKPLGDRHPFLLVHGLRGEYLPYFRWQKVADKLNKNEDFASRYKIYLVRYSSLDRIETVVPKFKEALTSLYSAAKQRPISIMALSMGGNISYEALTDTHIEPKVRLLFTMGTPFHGSPLFCKDWMNYTVYKRLAWPWTRIDHNLAFRLYFNRNKMLRQDLTWDNVDEAIPETGDFKSKLPFGPKGSLTVGDTINLRLHKVNSMPVDRKKLITYGGYISSPYLQPGFKRYIETTAFYPMFLLSNSFPAHFGREHPVLEFLNRDITNMQVSKKIAKQAGSPFIYALNDGICPITSAIFLPPDVARNQYIARESELSKVRDKVNVGQARVFKNVDHLTFIDGIRPVNPIIAAVNNQFRDELNPLDGQKDIFDWMLTDILNSEKTHGRLAKTDHHAEKAILDVKVDDVKIDDVKGIVVTEKAVPADIRVDVTESESAKESSTGEPATAAPGAADGQ
jgi:hypothetical protein